MGMGIGKNIGAFIKALGGNVLNDAGATVNSAALNRHAHKATFQSCKLVLSCGAASGTPTTQTADAKLQESADGSTGWADITGAAVTQVTADDTAEEVDVDLSGAEGFIRVVTTVAFTGGTSPAWPISALVTAGGADVYPQT